MRVDKIQHVLVVAKKVRRLMFVQYSEYDAVPPVKQYILSDLCNSFSSKVGNFC